MKPSRVSLGTLRARAPRDSLSKPARTFPFRKGRTIRAKGRTLRARAANAQRKT